MRLVKLGLISLLGLFLVIFLLSLLIPSSMRVSRAITINAPADTVLNYLNDMREWPRWNALLKNKELTEVQSERDLFSSAEMKIRIIARDTLGLIQSQWERNNQAPILSGINTTSVANATIVQWYFDFRVKWYPWEKFGSIVFDKELGPLMEISLDQLKKIAEKQNE